MLVVMAPSTLATAMTGVESAPASVVMLAAAAQQAVPRSWRVSADWLVQSVHDVTGYARKLADSMPPIECGL